MFGKCGFGQKVLAGVLLAAISMQGARLARADAPTEPLEKDLAIVLDRDDASLLAARTRLATGERLLPPAWLDAVSRAYERTSVGEALATENRYEDWHLMSLRVAPCAALGPTPASDVERLCWPEIRLVFQPLLRNVRIHERFARTFADDRAVHAIYDVAPELVLSPSDASRARELVARVRGAAAAKPFAPLDAPEIAELERLRDTVTRAFVADAVALRGPSPASAFSGLGLRPESLEGGSVAAAFGARLSAFVSRYAPPSRLRALTSFSLPEGREPAHLDEWVFLSFRVSSGALVPEPIVVTSAVDGRVLASLGTTPRASQTRDDDVLYEDRGGAGADELAASVLLGPADARRLGARIADRRQHLVPNTTCASCHKLNALRFDFHNLGYLEDRDVTISPRVAMDVSLDLAWLRAAARR